MILKNWLLIVIFLVSCFQLTQVSGSQNRFVSDYSFSDQLNIEDSYYLYNHSVKGYANVSVAVQLDILNITKDHLSTDNGTVVSNLTSYGIDVIIDLNILQSTFDSNVTLANVSLGMGSYYSSGIFFSSYSISVTKDFIINKSYITGDTINIHKQPVFTIGTFIPTLTNFSIELTTLTTDFQIGSHQLENGTMVFGPYNSTSTSYDDFYYPLDQNQLNDFARTTITYNKLVSTVTNTKTQTFSVPFMTGPLFLISILLVVIFKRNKSR